METLFKLVVVFFAGLATGGLIVNWIGLARAMWIRFHILRTLFSIPALAAYVLSSLLTR